MIPRPLPPQDLDRLSAYLDRQLAPEEVARLEARLAREPELAQALGELRATAQLLRNLPKLKTPRNFTLTAAQAPSHHRPQPVFGFLRLATALSALLLIFVVVGEFFTLRPAALAPQSETVNGTEGVEAEASPVVAESYALETPSAVDMDDGSGGAAAPTEAPATSETATPEMSIAAFASETLTPSPDAQRVLTTPLPPPADAVSKTEQTTTAPTLVEDSAPPVNAWRIAQVVLVLVTLALGIAAWRWRQ